MSKWPMRGHFGHLHFETFPMTPRTLQCKVFYPLLSNSKHSRVPEDSKSPTLGVWVSSSHLAKVGLRQRHVPSHVYIHPQHIINFEISSFGNGFTRNGKTSNKMMNNYWFPNLLTVISPTILTCLLHVGYWLNIIIQTLVHCNLFHFNFYMFCHKCYQNIQTCKDKWYTTKIGRKGNATPFLAKTPFETTRIQNYLLS
jgi:hypothetical protein